jgi:DNA-binding FadR family transcriptional regulator
VILERGGDSVYEDLIPAIATATRIACLQPEARKAADAAGMADTEIFGLLAESAGDPGVAGVLRLGSRVVRDLASGAGPLADGIISNSSRRLLAHVRAADADASEQEMEKLLRCLHVMWRLARCDKGAALTPDPEFTAGE